MNVTDAIIALSNGELKQLSIKNDQFVVMGYLNLGILELHKRFRLWEETALITMVDGTVRYKLDGVDANVTIDLSDHDILMIESLTDDMEEPISLNDDKDPLGAKTPRPHILDIKVPVLTGDITVNYRASPKFLTDGDDIIPLPPQFTEALFNYCGYRGHGSVKGDIKSENNTHYMRFDKSCDLIDFQGLRAADNLHSHKFEDRGFV